MKGSDAPNVRHDMNDRIAPSDAAAIGQSLAASFCSATPFAVSAQELHSQALTFYF